MRRMLALFLVLLLSFSLAAEEKTFALVLSGGGAKGIAHIEVLKELDRRGLYPDYVIGTSIGSLIGAFYASGYSGEEIEKLIRNEDMLSLFTTIYTGGSNEYLEGGDESPVTNLITINFSDYSVGSANGLIDDLYISRFFRTNLIKVLSIRDFDELSIPYRAVGTDLETGEEIVYSSGSLYGAMRGSMAIPLVFTPFKDEWGHYVVDGGLVNNLPADIARDLGADVVLAVDLNDVTRSHGILSPYNDVETLTGVVFQLIDLETQPNAAKNYKYADYMIIPDLSDYGIMDFLKVEEILEIGRNAVEESQALFDSLEEELEKNGRIKPLSYSEREPFVIKSIICKGLTRYTPQFNRFVGKTADKETAEDLEALLLYIKRQENLKSIGYDVYDGTLILWFEEYSRMMQKISLGLNLEAGVKGSIMDSSTLFYFMPHASAVLSLTFPGSYGTLKAGLDLKDYASLFASYFYNFENDFSLFASAMAGIGDISMLSIADRIDRIDTSDFIFSIEAGAAFESLAKLRIEASIDLDLIALGPLKSYDTVVDEVGITVVFDPKLNINLKYHALDYASLENGINIDFDADIYLKASLMYTLSLALESIIPLNSDAIRLYIGAEAATLRGNEAIGSSYRTNRSGNITRDYVSLSLGTRYLFMEKFDMQAGFFFELYETRDYQSRLWVSDYSLIPFSMINDWALGLSFALGYNTQAGNISVFADITHRGAFSLGVRLR